MEQATDPAGATETPRKSSEGLLSEAQEAASSTLMPSAVEGADGANGSAAHAHLKDLSGSPATTLDEVDPEETNGEVEAGKEEAALTSSQEEGDVAVEGDGGVDAGLDAGMVEKLKADLAASQGKSEDELKLIRTLLQAEATHDAGELIDAQDIILSSGMAEGLEEIKQSPNIQNAQKVRQCLQDSPFKPHHADFTELVSGLPPGNGEQSEAEAPREPGSTAPEAAGQVNIPAGGLNDEECAAFVGSYEENLVVNALMEKLPLEQFEALFEQDPEFRKEFRWWARACLRARRYRLERAVDLLSKYAAWRKDIMLVSTNQSKLKAQLESGFCIFLEDARCVDGRAILLVRGQFHDPSKYKPQDVAVALHNVILYALRSDDLIQAQGFTILHDMTKLRYRNLDFGLFEQLSRCFNSTFPMRYGRLILYNPPFFFSAVYRIASIFLSKKMKERLLKVPKQKKHPAFVTLAKHVHQKDLPSYMGGGQELNSELFATSVISALFPISKSLEKTISHETT